jgi:HK97 family phage prohead protease
MDSLEIKAALAVTDAGEITGTAWPFNAGPDRAGDLIETGAFGAVITDLPMLLAHDPEQPVGLWEDVRETAEGLQVKGRLFIDESKRALAVRSLIHGGLIGGLSIGFVTKSAITRGRNRVITALDLKEISVVRHPSHPRARIASAKNATAAIAEAINRAAVALRRP